MKWDGGSKHVYYKNIYFIVNLTINLEVVNTWTPTASTCAVSQSKEQYEGPVPILYPAWPFLPTAYVGVITTQSVHVHIVDLIYWFLHVEDILVNTIEGKVYLKEE
jgi:hypothetical protein